VGFGFDLPENDNCSECSETIDAESDDKSAGNRLELKMLVATVGV
jgi:hypothetical protein